MQINPLGLVLNHIGPDEIGLDSGMCGFGGYFGDAVAPPLARPLIDRMIASIAHRGPDEQGIYTAPSIGLGHARLSIVGLGDGQQPMSHADGDFTIVFNGEIFNYVELRQQLISQGHVFRTGSDTEVILHLYQRMGPDCLSMLNGDFAFAIWDARERRIMLARDRMGVRPLFYTTVGSTLYFASEIKALLQVPASKRKLILLRLTRYSRSGRRLRRAQHFATFSNLSLPISCWQTRMVWRPDPTGRCNTGCERHKHGQN